MGNQKEAAIAFISLSVMRRLDELVSAYTLMTGTVVHDITPVVVEPRGIVILQILLFRNFLIVRRTHVTTWVVVVVRKNGG